MSHERSGKRRAGDAAAAKSGMKGVLMGVWQW